MEGLDYTTLSVTDFSLRDAIWEHHTADTNWSRRHLKHLHRLYFPVLILKNLQGLVPS